MFSWLRGLIQKRIVRILMPIYETNRLVIFLYKKPPFYRWLKRVDPDHPVKANKDNRRGNAYLLPLIVGDSEGSLIAYLEKHYHQMAMTEVTDWIRDPDLWPDDINTFEAFCKWFDWDTPEVVYDLTSPKFKRKHTID